MVARRTLYMLLATMFAITLGVYSTLGFTTSTSGVVTILVSGYIALSPVDSASSVRVNPSNAPLVEYDGVALWAAVNASDDMVFNMTGTNVNLTIWWWYAVEKPPSYPQGMMEPIVSVLPSIDSVSSSEQLQAVGYTTPVNYTIVLDPEKTNLGVIYADTGSRVTWVDIPEGFLNTLYSRSLNETEWYPYIYASNVTLHLPLVAYNPSTGTLVYNKSVELCIMIVDPDSSLQATSVSGDEAILLAPTCKMDIGDSNSTAPETPPSRVDLASDADYAVPGGVAALQDTGAPVYYAYNSTDYTVLNASIELPDGSVHRVYFIAEGLTANQTGIYVTLIPAYPLPYSATLSQLYSNGNQPYLHMWPFVALPVGAPAGVYKATVYVAAQQT